jgi:hypothetical protein
LKIDRNRARKGAVVARRFSVSPVTRAVRSVLTVSAAALAFSGTGLALASAPVHTTQAPAFAAQHADLSQHAAFAPSVPVVDLTLVGDTEHPASVVAGDLGLQAALADSDAQYAGPVGPADGSRIERVLDLTTVQSLVAGPGNGNGSGIDDVAVQRDDRRGSPYSSFVNVAYGATVDAVSPSGYADAVFSASDTWAGAVNNGTLNATGATWAAGMEVEGGYQAWAYSNGDINAIATGIDGQAIGMYAAAADYANAHNRGTVYAAATNTNGLAVGLFAYGNRNASTYNFGDVRVIADGTAAGLVSAGNSHASSINRGNVLAVGNDATGMSAESFYNGQASVYNGGRIYAYGIASAVGERATTVDGMAFADNRNYILAVADDSAIGMQAEGGNYTRAMNFGDVVAIAYSGTATGISATSTNANTRVYSTGYVGAGGVFATGIETNGDTGAYVRKSGSINVFGIVDATGISASSHSGNTSVYNHGAIDVYAYFGVATGQSGSNDVGTATVRNDYISVISAYSFYDSAIGELASTISGTANALNGGTIKVDGVYGTGMQAQASGTGTANANNYGVVSATGIVGAYGVVAISANGTALARNSRDVSATASGVAMGVVAIGQDATATNSNGTITATSNDDMAIGMFGAGSNVHVQNDWSGTVLAYGVEARGLDAEGDTSAYARNMNTIVANGDTSATGIFALSGGDTTVENWSRIDVDSANGTAYGINVRNLSLITTDGSSLAAGVFAVGGNTHVRNYGQIQSTATAGDGFAVGVLALYGDVNVDNMGQVTVRGTYATGVDIRADGAAYGVNRSSIRAYGSLATGMSVHTDGETANAVARNNSQIYVNATAAAVGMEAVARAYQGTAQALNYSNITLQATYANSAQGLVAAADLNAQAINNSAIFVHGGSNAYGELVLSADGSAVATNNAYVSVDAAARGGTAFGAVAQSSTGGATVDNNGFMRAIGDNATGAYATANWSDALIDNSGTLQVTANTGNAFGGLAYSYLNNASIINSGDIRSTAIAAQSVGVESLSIFGDADIVNTNAVRAYGETRSRGLISRSLYGDASVTNSGFALASANGNAYGAWARADYAGTSDVDNSGYVRALSGSGTSTALRSGGYAGATIENGTYATGLAQGNTVARGALAYSQDGDAKVTNDGWLRAYSNGNAYGVLASAYGIATVTNNRAIIARGNGYADGIYAAGASVVVDHAGSISVYGRQWSAGVESHGDVISVLTTGDISSYSRNGNAFGVFALANDDATVRNNGTMYVTSVYGSAYGQFAVAGDHAITTNGGNLNVRAFNGVAYGVLASGADVDSTNDGNINAQGAIAAIGMAGAGDTHSILINHGSIIAQGTGYGSTAIGLYSYALGFARGVNDDYIRASTNVGNVTGMSVYGDTAVVENQLGGYVRAYSNNGTAIGSYSWGTIANTVTNDGRIAAHTGYGNAFGVQALGDGNVQVDASATSWINANTGPGGYSFGILAQGDVAGVDNAGFISANGSGTFFAGIAAGGYTSATIGNTGNVYATAGKYAAATSIGLTGDAHGDTTIVNGGKVTVGGGNTAIGIKGSTYAGTASVSNAGTINANDAFTHLDIGIAAHSTYGDVLVDNTGTINAGGTFFQPKYGFASITDMAIGVQARAYYGNATVTNANAINILAATYGAGLTADADNGIASVHNTGIVRVTVNGGDLALGLGASSTAGQALVDNAHDVTVVNTFGMAIGASADGNAASATNTGAISVTGVGGAIGMAAYGDVQADVLNDRTVDVSLTTAGMQYAPAATGLMSYASTGTATATNNGTVRVHAYDRAVGIDASGNGDSTANNTRDVLVYGNHGSATGVMARDMDYADGNLTSVTNSGLVLAVSQYAWAEGVFASGENVVVSNAATGIVDASGDNWAAGVGLAGDNVAATNDGSISAQAIGSGYTYAVGITGYAEDALAITNHADIVAGSQYGVAKGVHASGAGTVVVDNSGSIAAGAYGYAIGINAEGFDDGSVSIHNTNAITAASASEFADGIFASGETIGIDNGGHIDATSVAWAAGVEVDGGTVDIANGGHITATSNGGGQASGIYAYADTALTIGNTGDITASAHDGTAFGISANGDAASTAVTNGGHIVATSAYGDAIGVLAYGDSTSVGNTNIVIATGYSTAMGLRAGAYGDAQVTNDGTVNAQAVGPGHTYAVGITGFAHDALAITNHAGIVAESQFGVAKGVSAYGYGTVVVGNTGDIAAEAFGYATGIHGEAFDDGTVAITNGGDITATSTGNGQATGIYAHGGSALAVTNTRDVIATAQAGDAFAIGMYGEYAAASVTNRGSLAATSTSGNATGVFAQGDATTVSNAGTIDALGHDAAFGIQAGAFGTTTVTGNGTIHATANQQALGIGANGDIANVNVGGNLFATADQATGIRASGDTSASVATTSHVTASGVHYAIGVQVGADASSFHNTGIVSAAASGDDALSAGAMVFGDTASITNGGTLMASGSGHDSQSIGAFVVGGDVSLANTATITSSSLYGATVGALVGAKYGNGTVANSGTITATGHAGGTTGLVAMSDGDLSVTNSGTITANDAGYAVAMGLYADGTATLTNTGTIVANSNLEGSIAIAGGDGIEDIRNASMISGALVLGDGNDVLTNQNHGTWIVRGHGTDFGGGDDHIVNAAGGTIVMNDSAISLGGHASAGNSFINAGLIAVNGDDNSIDLGTGLASPALMQSSLHTVAAAPVTVLNPIAFTNNGTISFLDGVTDDVLTIHGDFAGQGALNVDVSLLNQTSDMLYVDGNVVDGTKQALNVRVLNLPNTVEGINIPVVSITGDSKTGEFVAGTFSIDRVILNANNFVNVKIGITDRINTANATADLFSLTVAMDGVNDTGSLAGDIATGAQSLMTTQVGTFRQRMGVFSRMGDSDTGAWVRVFHDKGTITPDFTLDNMPQNGRFGFEQTNSGVEAGVNAYVTDGFFVGATLGKSEGKQSLDNGFGSDKLKGDTAGLYMTYLSPNGFYADVSYRWMHFDAELTSAGGRQDSGGDVGAFNVEAGWNVWTSASGLKLVPQAQYTRSEVSNVDILHGELTDFAIDGGTSSRGRAGLELEQTFKSASGATWTPYGALSVVREFDGEQGFTIADTFTGHTSTEGTSGMLEVGANVKMGNLDIFGGLNWTDGGAFDSILGGQVGLRYTW